MSEPLVLHVKASPPVPGLGVLVYVTDDEGHDVLPDVTVSDRGVLSISVQLPEDWAAPG